MVGLAGWGEYQAIPIIIEIALWLQVRMAKVHTPPMILYCYLKNQGCAIAKRGDLLHLTFAVQWLKC